MAKPVLVEAYVDYGVVSAETAMPGFARNNLLHRGGAVHLHVEIEHLFPHGNQKTKMPLVSGVLLRRLQLDGLVGIRHRPKQRRGRFTHLEIDRAVLDLDDDVLVEFTVERMEIIIGGAAAVVFRISPIQVMVIYEG